MRLLIRISLGIVLLSSSASSIVEARSSREAQAKQDTVACGELRDEYVRVCTGKNEQRRAQKDKDFCNAFENVCFEIPDGEPDKAPIPIKKDEAGSSADGGSTSSQTSSSSSSGGKKINFTRFCREFKNRYLYVCPDPFRFGQKAIVFCPVYSEKCHVPLPDKPVVPKPKGTRKRGGGTMEKMCRSYRGFAENYCSNPFVTSQGQYRVACDRYWKFCGQLHRG